MFNGLIYQATNLENTLPAHQRSLISGEMFEDDFNPYLQAEIAYKTGIEVNDYREFADEYEEGLHSDFWGNIYNPEVPFDQTEDLKNMWVSVLIREICGENIGRI